MDSLEFSCLMDGHWLNLNFGSTVIRSFMPLHPKLRRDGFRIRRARSYATFKPAEHCKKMDSCTEDVETKVPFDYFPSLHADDEALSLLLLGGSNAWT